MSASPDAAGASHSPSPPARLAVLTGAIRAGKTSAAFRVVELARTRGYLCGGFLSPDRLGMDGQKVGIDVVILPDGDRRLLALVDGHCDGPRVGRYSFEQASIDWAIACFRRALVGGCDLLVADELGRLEFERGKGFAPLLPDLAAGQCRRALVVVRHEHCNRLAVQSERVALRVFELSPLQEEREQVPGRVLRWLFEGEPGVSG